MYSPDGPKAVGLARATGLKGVPVPTDQVPQGKPGGNRTPKSVQQVQSVLGI